MSANRGFGFTAGRTVRPGSGGLKVLMRPASGPSPGFCFPICVFANPSNCSGLSGGAVYNLKKGAGKRSPAPFAVRGLCGLLRLDDILAAHDAAEEIFALGIRLGSRDERLDACSALSGDGV